MKKVLVTGGAGFIGSHLVDALVEKGFAVVVLDNLSSGKKENLNSEAKFYKADIRDVQISEIFENEKPEYVFHLASHISLRESIKNPIKDAEINILGSLNLLSQCVKFRVKKVIFSSSAGVYSEMCELPTSETDNLEPVSPYGITKLTIENYLRVYREIYGLDYVILRYANIFGPRQNSDGEGGVIAVFSEKILKGEQPVIHCSGKQTRDFVYVKNIVEANIFSLSLSSGIYNVGTGVQISVNELFKKIVEISGKSLEPFYDLSFNGGQFQSALDSRKLKSAGFKFNYSFDEGLRKTIEWFRNK